MSLGCFGGRDGLANLEEEAQGLLGNYIAAILKDEASSQQFWALGKSYYSLRGENPGSEAALLAPIVIFKVRGSVSASGGHIPEDILRKMMLSWGMERGVDFNVDDVIIEYAKKVGNTNTKTRAYDFVLPYKTPGWHPHMFVQCQYYAGDSGSVSHKVVDQTQASRPLTLREFPDARFIEYLDGAGYYSSLNTDLQHMLGMPSTKEFIQIRSAHIKLRRELQDVGFLTPIDIEHSVFRSSAGKEKEVVNLLTGEGYSDQEIERALKLSIDRQFIHSEGGRLFVTEKRAAFAKRLFIVDLIAVIGGPVQINAGNALIPGYGALYGCQLNMISQRLDEYAPNASYSRNEFADCITWLTEEKLIILR